MSELVLENSDEIVSREEKKDTKEILTKKNDLKFLVDVSIMVMFNIMLIAWSPYIEIPVTICLLILSIILHFHIKRFKEENNLEV